jgi:hypothetical protein
MRRLYDKMTKKKQEERPSTLGLALVILPLLTLYGWFAYTVVTYEPPEDRVTTSDASQVCRDWIEGKLERPAFIYVTDWQKEGRHFIIRGWIESIRRDPRIPPFRFYCRVAYKGGGEWEYIFTNVP